MRKGLKFASCVALIVGCFVIFSSATMRPEAEIPARLEEPEPTVTVQEPIRIERVPFVEGENIQLLDSAFVLSIDDREVPPWYTEEELEILAIIIYQEAGGDYASDDTRIKVGEVFLNRVNDPRFPDSFEEVATAKGQYGELYWTGIKWPDRAQYAGEAHAVARAWEIAERVLDGERTMPEDVVFQSEFIMGEIVAAQDGHYFCK